MDGQDSSHGSPQSLWERSTAPQSSYTGREIGIGIAVFLVGLLVAFGIPIALA